MGDRSDLLGPLSIVLFLCAAFFFPIQDTPFSAAAGQDSQLLHTFFLFLFFCISLEPRWVKEKGISSTNPPVHGYLPSLGLGRCSNYISPRINSKLTRYSQADIRQQIHKPQLDTEQHSPINSKNTSHIHFRYERTT